MSKMMVSEEMKNAPAAPSPLRRLLCWEGFLLAVTLAVFIGNAVASPYFLNIWNLSGSRNISKTCHSCFSGIAGGSS